VDNGTLNYDVGAEWRTLKADPINPYTFGNGLTNTDNTITNNLTVGSASGSQTIIGGLVHDGNDIITIQGTDTSFLNFGSQIKLVTNDTNGITTIDGSGAWTFGANGFDTQITLNGYINATKYIYAGQGINSGSDLRANTTLTLNRTNFAVLFDATTGITANRTFTFPNATTMLAGLSVANVFTTKQTFSFANTSLVFDELNSTSVIIKENLNNSFYIQAYSLIIRTNGTNQRFYINGNGLIANGTNTSPTCFFDFQASTTSYASLRIRSGTAPTSPNDGDIWYDGTNIKIRVGATTKTFTLI
jgi:hypothetical protein